MTIQSLDRDPLILVHDVARLMRTRFDQFARSYEMTRAQWVILARLQRQPGLSQNELAAICEVEPITVARQVDRLEGRGYVERRPDPSDRRIKRLHLLPAAAPIIQEMAHMRDLLAEECFAGLSEKERETLSDLLIVMKETLSTHTTYAAKPAMVEE